MSNGKDEKSIWNRTPKNPLGETITIHWRMKEWYKDIPPKLVDTFKIFFDETMKSHKELSLIGVKTISNADSVHFADSYMAAKVIMEARKPKHVFDLGTGNGFPGLVMAAMYPSLKVTIVDTDEKRCQFIKQTAQKMGLLNIHSLATHFDKLPDNSMEVGVTRGLASVSKCALLFRKSFTIGGELYHLKGEEWFKEISDMPTQLCSIWKASLVGEYSLPVGEVKFAVVKTSKYSA